MLGKKEKVFWVSVWARAEGAQQTDLLEEWIRRCGCGSKGLNWLKQHQLWVGSLELRECLKKSSHHQRLSSSSYPFRKKKRKKRSNYTPVLKWFIFPCKNISITSLYSRGGKKHQDNSTEVGALEGCFTGRIRKWVSLVPWKHGPLSLNCDRNKFPMVGMLFPLMLCQHLCTSGTWRVTMTLAWSFPVAWDTCLVCSR